MRRAMPWLVVLSLLALIVLYARDWISRYPQSVPWTALDLDQPIGSFTMRKLVKLGDAPAQCRALLSEAGASYRPAAERRNSPDCGYTDGVQLVLRAGLSPPGVATSCPIAAALFLLDREVIQLAAMRHFGREVVAIRHLGSYSCRRLYGGTDGPFSEHATADAIDISGFVLADGTRISVLADWKSDGPKSLFLREVRDGACDLFATVLSPDYNAAHADHLHLDLAERGRAGWSLCR